METMLMRYALQQTRCIMHSAALISTCDVSQRSTQIKNLVQVIVATLERL